jgi:hypothetical protein
MLARLSYRLGRFSIMPSKDAHLAAVAANQGTIEFLLADAERHLPWIATVAFYKALHIVEALFAADPRSPVEHTDNHKVRGKILKTTSRYQKIWSMYRELHQASLIARYLHESDDKPTVDVFSKYMPRAKVEGLLLGHFLIQIEKSACSLLGDADFLKAKG